MDTLSLMLALQLQQQDLNLWEQSKKGKQRQGEVADSDLAFEACRHELELMTAQISDQVMALSIARAVESDGQLIREAQLAEEQAVKDREYAVRLSRDPNAAKRSDAEKGNKLPRVNEEEDDLIDILRSMNLGGLDGSTSGQPESSTWAALRKAPQMKECIACNDRFPPLALSRSPCSHEYCRECIVGLVRSSLQDETLFPPRCCGQNIPVTKGRWFSPELVASRLARRLRRHNLSQARQRLAPDASGVLASIVKGGTTVEFAQVILPRSKSWSLRLRMAGSGAMLAIEWLS
ncbi:hypothetical protein H9Q70_003819 [Fusarium xylarioides]|nr:hypothetical protein H9Q70_003819 [Fusarium xylarioides]KAG5783095.1 hypothetical protein H9Q73_003287 [Fusarium xylarioides]